jgi:hypothetical protein
MNNTNFPLILQNFEGHLVEVNVIGAIKIPYYFDKLEICISKEMVCFGQCDCEKYLFELWLDTLEVITLEEDFIKLKIDYAGLVTYLEITKH